jgi:outer membrane receptor protein involved in Fe transport
LHASVFWQEKQDFIFQDTNRQNISNGETRHQGIELSGKYELSPSLYVSGNATYAKHEYANAIAISNTNIEGNEIDTAPKTIGSAQLGWKVNDAIQTELSLQHVGNYFLNPENTAEYDGHTLLDLNFRYQYSSQLRFNANVYNLLDTDYAERADFGFGNYRYFVGQPRRIFVGATWSWSQK